MKITDAIDAFPTLCGVRAGVDADATRAWFFDTDAFIAAARTHGSGATLCACFVVSCAGYSVPKFHVAALFAGVDSAHRAAALAVFTVASAKGGLQ